MTFSTLRRLGAWRSGGNLFLALGTLRGSMVGEANRAAMYEAANAGASHAKPVVPRPADDGRRTPAWFGERPSDIRTSGMKIEELYVDTGPICKSSRSSMFAKRSIVRKPSVALKLAVCAQDQEFIQC